jgi:hypothetical protein
MADAVVLKTKKIFLNKLLSRRQMIIEVCALLLLLLSLLGYVDVVIVSGSSR